MVNNRTWINDIRNIVIDPILIPTNNMSIDQQINCITRLAIASFVILLLFTSSINSLIFLFISLGLIIFIYEYYKTMNHNTRENFTFKSPKYCKSNTIIQNEKSLQYLSKPNISTERKVFCDESIKLNPGPNFVSRNQALVGPPNPRTKINPIIVNPAYDLDSWRDNNSINFSQINRPTNEDMYLSGVEPSISCGSLNNTYNYPINNNLHIIHNSNNSNNSNNNNLNINPNLNEIIDEGFCNGNECKRKIKHKNTNDSHIYGDLIESDEHKNTNIFEDSIGSISGSVNKQCGYNPNQISNSNLPVNYPASNCEQSKNVSNYNKNLFTQIIQPGVYYNSDVIEPINSNIGISFNQQIQPTSCEFIQDDGILYKAHDPSLVDVVIHNDKESVNNAVDNANIYDPRHTGYGTSYRAYTHDVTGQTRFMYDDINSIRMPNYICRSNIDFEKYADSYGPIKEHEEFGNLNTSNIRDMVQDSWLKNSLQFRNDLTMMRSRKQLAESWQRRVAPIHTRNTKSIASLR